MLINKKMAESNYTREEFIKKLQTEKYGQASNDGTICPSNIGAKDLKNCEFLKIDCKGCWVRAIKSFKFVGENKLKEQ